MPNWFWPYFILVTMYGACVGSFLNVVIYRLPEGKSLWRSASACPKCGHQIRWWENIPIFAWLALRGRCRGCKQRIPLQYLLIELLGAASYAALFYMYYRSGFQPAFAELEIKGSWPVLVVHLLLLGSLLAATVIDARLYIIPLIVPWFTIMIALIFLPISAMWVPEIERMAPLAPTTVWVNACFGAVVGLAVAMLLLRLGVLPRSFDDIEAFIESQQQNNPEKQQRNNPGPDASPRPTDGLPQPSDIIDINDWLTYPHARREILKEILFLVPPVAGAIIGGMLVPVSAAGRTGMTYHVSIHVLGGVLLGLFVGALLIWATRILGTLAFGKEAMGLGDVHLLAAIGAVLGPRDAAIVFFIAPFIGLAYAAAEFGMTKLLKVRHRPIPYGPHLAVAAFVLMLLRRPVLDFISTLFAV